MCSTEKRRALRRHHKDRFRRKAREIGKRWEVKDVEGFCRKSADNLTSCSCWMCGNPRRWGKRKTRKEIEADRKFREELEELG